MTTEDTLRRDLHALDLVPPPDLGEPREAVRRGRALRRRRITAVCVAAVVALAVPAVPLLRPTADSPGWTGNRGGGPLLPDWPRRGDVTDPALDRAAIEIWKSVLTSNRTATWGEPRVLYAGGGTDRTVVVLFGTARRGGDRLVVLTRTDGRFTVYADRPAPDLGTAAVTVVVDRPQQSFDAPDACVPPVRAGGARLLVLGAPRATAARYRLVDTRPARCGSADTPWQPVVLADDAALVPLPLGNRDDVEVDVEAPPLGVSGRPTVPAKLFPEYYGIRTHSGAPSSAGSAALPWRYRTDGSRARGHEDALQVGEFRSRGGICMVHWSASLPDGTPVLLCAADEDNPRVEVVAEGPDGRLRGLLNSPGLDAPAYAVVVEGRSARWLVFVGPPDLRKASLLDGGAERAIPLQAGSGFLELTADPSPDARVAMPGLPPVPVHRQAPEPLRHSG